MSVCSLRAIIQPFVLAMFDPGCQVGFCGTVRPQLVCDDHAWLAPGLEQFPEKAHRGRLVPAGLDQNIQHIPVAIDSPPEPVFATLDRHHDLITMPFVGRAWSIPPDLRSKLYTETRDPVPDRFVGNRDAPRFRQIFNITKAEREPMLGPNRIANDQARETEPLETGQIRQIQHGIALQRQVALNNLTVPASHMGTYTMNRDMVAQA